MIPLGLGISIRRIGSGLESLPLDREAILVLVVSPLIFEAAMRTRYDVLKTVRRTY
jgi:NhaP-type Na+/H+ or K+/H+ antiporter